MTQDPLEMLFEAAHRLQPDDLCHRLLETCAGMCGRRPRRRRQSRLMLHATGRVQYGQQSWEDMEEIELSTSALIAYRPPGYARPLYVSRPKRPSFIIRYVQERWYVLVPHGPLLQTPGVSWFCLKLQPPPGDERRWIPLPPDCRQIALATLENDGEIAIDNAACERLPLGASAAIVTPRGDILRHAGSDVTTIGEPLSSTHAYFHKRQRIVAYREGQWFELVSTAAPSDRLHQ